MQLSRKLVFAAYLFILSGAMLFGQTPQLINYQGHFTDDNGDPRNGSFNVQFTIYDAEMAGSNLWTETHTGLNVSDGLFNVLLGSVDAFPTDLFSGTDMRYLEISVGAETLSPRQRITSVAYAIHAHEADSAGTVADNSITPFKIVNTAVTSAKINANAVTAAKIADNAVTAAKIADNAVGASEIAANAVGQSEIATSGVATAEILDNTITANDIATDAVGALELGNNSVASANIIDNSITVNDIATNGVGSAEIAPSAVGSTEILNNSVTDVDIQDEPGIANAKGPFTIFGTVGTTVEYDRVAITIPSPGYVFVIATGYVVMDHITGFDTEGHIGIDRVSASLSLGNGGINVFVEEGNRPTGFPLYGFSTSEVYIESTGGAKTYYLNAELVRGTAGSGFRVAYGNFTAMFFPTAYGTVTQKQSNSNNVTNATTGE